MSRRDPENISKDDVGEILIESAGKPFPTRKRAHDVAQAADAVTSKRRKEAAPNEASGFDMQAVAPVGKVGEVATMSERPGRKKKKNNSHAGKTAVTHKASHRKTPRRKKQTTIKSNLGGMGFKRVHDLLFQLNSNNSAKVKAWVDKNKSVLSVMNPQAFISQVEFDYGKQYGASLAVSVRDTLQVAIVQCLSEQVAAGSGACAEAVCSSDYGKFETLEHTDYKPTYVIQRVQEGDLRTIIQIFGVDGEKYNALLPTVDKKQVYVSAVLDGLSMVHAANDQVTLTRNYFEYYAIDSYTGACAPPNGMAKLYEMLVNETRASHKVSDEFHKAITDFTTLKKREQTIDRLCHLAEELESLRVFSQRCSSSTLRNVIAKKSAGLNIMLAKVLERDDQKSLPKKELRPRLGGHVVASVGVSSSGLGSASGAKKPRKRMQSDRPNLHAGRKRAEESGSAGQANAEARQVRAVPDQDVVVIDKSKLGSPYVGATSKSKAKPRRKAVDIGAIAKQLNDEIQSYVDAEENMAWQLGLSLSHIKGSHRSVVNKIKAAYAGINYYMQKQDLREDEATDFAAIILYLLEVFDRIDQNESVSLNRSVCDERVGLVLSLTQSLSEADPRSIFELYFHACEQSKKASIYAILTAGSMVGLLDPELSGGSIDHDYAQFVVDLVKLDTELRITEVKNDVAAMRIRNKNLWLAASALGKVPFRISFCRADGGPLSLSRAGVNSLNYADSALLFQHLLGLVNAGLRPASTSSTLDMLRAAAASVDPQDDVASAGVVMPVTARSRLFAPQTAQAHVDAGAAELFAAPIFPSRRDEQTPVPQEADTMALLLKAAQGILFKP